MLLPEAFAIVLTDLEDGAILFAEFLVISFFKSRRPVLSDFAALWVARPTLESIQVAPGGKAYP